MKNAPALFCLLLAISLNTFTIAKAQVNQKDSLALVDFYNSTNGANWYTNSNWLTQAPVATWAGIVVDSNRVTYVSLSGNNLRGHLPLSFSNLSALHVLDLSRNHIGDSVPTVITQLVSLTYLNLGYNHFGGTIPASIGNLTNLITLHLDNNNLSGEMPSAIGNLTNLVNLYVYINQLSGSLPSTIGNLAKLTDLWMEYNNLTGRFPASIGALTNLRNLFANNNQLTGLPAEIGNLTKLYDLELAHNRLTDTLPSSMSNFINLFTMDISFNNLGGTIPSFLGALPKIYTLHLDHNHFGGSIPKSFGKNRTITNLYLQNNHLSQNGNVALLLFPRNLANSNISHNLFTFDGLEGLVQHSPYTIYSPQAAIPVHRHGDTLSVYAGGTLQNNTYTWIEDAAGRQFTANADSAFMPRTSGRYYAKIKNSLVTDLILHSDTVTVTVNNLTAANRSVTDMNNIESKEDFRVYPNPATTTVYLQMRDAAIVEVVNNSGKILLTKSINKSGNINVTAFTNGTYYFENKATGEVRKVLIAH